MDEILEWSREPAQGRIASGIDKEAGTSELLDMKNAGFWKENTMFESPLLIARGSSHTYDLRALSIYVGRPAFALRSFGRRVTLLLHFLQRYS